MTDKIGSWSTHHLPLLEKILRDFPLVLLRLIDEYCLERGPLNESLRLIRWRPDDAEVPYSLRPKEVLASCLVADGKNVWIVAAQYDTSVLRAHLHDLLLATADDEDEVVVLGQCWPTEQNPLVVSRGSRATVRIRRHAVFVSRAAQNGSIGTIPLSATQVRHGGATRQKRSAMWPRQPRSKRDRSCRSEAFKSYAWHPPVQHAK